MSAGAISTPALQLGANSSCIIMTGLGGPQPDSVVLTTTGPPTDEPELLLRFCSLMLRSGNTAARTREISAAFARNLGLENVSIGISFDAVTISARCRGAWSTRMLEVGAPHVDVWRIAEAEHFSRTAGMALPLSDIAARLRHIGLTKHRYSQPQLVAAIGAASAAFAYLNGAPPVGVMAAAVGGCIGHAFRSLGPRLRLSQYGAVALSAVAAASASLAGLALVRQLGIQSGEDDVGVMAAALFLVPGYPAIAALFDQLQGQTVAAVSRFAHAVMVLAALTFGLGIVIVASGSPASETAAEAVAYPLKLLLRGGSSFVAGAAFALAFNTPVRLAAAIGVLAAAANSLRLYSMDAGVSAVLAAFLAAAFVGIIALVAEARLRIPPLALSVAPIVIMVPGMQAFRAVAFFDQDKMADALQAIASFSFGISALAAGLAAAIFLKPAIRTSQSLPRPYDFG